MKLQHGNADRLASLAARLAQASAKAAEAQAELKKAERRCERSDATVSALREEYDQERLRLWGNTPDVGALLEPNGSTTFYYAAQALAELHGLGHGMQWADTKQAVLHIRVNRGDAEAIAKTAAAVRYFAPFIKGKGSMKRFGVQHHESGEFALELRYAPKSDSAQIVRMCHGSEDSKESFASLNQALQHLAQHHWLEDIFEMEARTPLLA
jgi:hypothetical protein